MVFSVDFLYDKKCMPYAVPIPWLRHLHNSSPARVMSVARRSATHSRAMSPNLSCFMRAEDKPQTSVKHQRNDRARIQGARTSACAPERCSVRALQSNPRECNARRVSAHCSSPANLPRLNGEVRFLRVMSPFGHKRTVMKYVIRGRSPHVHHGVHEAEGRQSYYTLHPFQNAWKSFNMQDDDYHFAVMLRRGASREVQHHGGIKGMIY